MDCSLPGSSVHEILQARTLEWVATSFSRGSSRPRNQTQVSCIAGMFFTNWALREALLFNIVKAKNAKEIDYTIEQTLLSYIFRESIFN